MSSLENTKSSSKRKSKRRRTTNRHTVPLTNRINGDFEEWEPEALFSEVSTVCWSNLNDYSLLLPSQEPSITEELIPPTPTSPYVWPAIAKEHLVLILTGSASRPPSRTDSADSKPTVVSIVNSEKDIVDQVFASQSSRINSIDDIFKSEEVFPRKHLMRYLRERKCAEMLTFLDSYSDLQQLSNPSSIFEANRALYEKFVRSQDDEEGKCSTELGVDPEMKMTLEKMIDNDSTILSDKQVFKNVKAEVQTMLRFHFNHYRESAQFFQLESKLRKSDTKEWRKSFDCVVDDDRARKVFLKFLMQEKSEENFTFILACYKLKQCTQTADIEKNVKAIYEQYIEPPEGEDEDDLGFGVGGHFTSLNIDWKVKEHITETYKTNPRDKYMFDKAVHLVLQMLHDDGFQRFKSSEVLKVYEDAPMHAYEENEGQALPRDDELTDTAGSGGADKTKKKKKKKKKHKEVLC